MYHIKFFIITLSLLSQLMPDILALGRQKYKNHSKFKATVGYRVAFCLNPSMHTNIKQSMTVHHRAEFIMQNV